MLTLQLFEVKNFSDIIAVSRLIIEKMNDKNPIKIKNFTLDYNSNDSKININDKGNINNNNN